MRSVQRPADCVVAVLAITLGLVPVAAAQLPAAARFADDIARFAAADSDAPPQPGGVLFVGSSSIRMWETLAADFPDVAVFNRGFGGSELEDVIRYADRIVFPYAPRLIVLYAGDNDIAAGKTPARVFADYRAFADTACARLPAVRLAYISIKPSPARWALVDSMRAANALIERHTRTNPRLVYIDVFTPMLRADGMPRDELFLEDGLHLNARGYALWRERVAPYLE